MAELIDKPTMLDWVQKQVEAVTKKQVAGSDGIFTREVLTTMQRNLGTFENAINAMPTTTEAEIRAKAIDEFAEKFIYKVHCEGCSGCTNCYKTGTQDNCDTYRYFAEAAEELKAEQLKEE